jgi:hypothetical protein
MLRTTSAVRMPARPSGSGSADTRPLAASTGSVPIRATFQKCGRTSCALRRSPARARRSSISITGPTTTSRFSAISPGMIRSTNPSTTISATSRSAATSAPHGSERSTSLMRAGSPPCSALTRRLRKPARNTAPSRLTSDELSAPNSAATSPAWLSAWSTAISTAVMTRLTAIETTRIRPACRRPVRSTAAAMDRAGSAG